MPLRNTALKNNHINFTHNKSFLKLYLRNRVLYSSIYIRHIQYCVPDSKCIDFIKISFSLDINVSWSHEDTIPVILPKHERRKQNTAEIVNYNRDEKQKQRISRTVDS